MCRPRNQFIALTKQESIRGKKQRASPLLRKRREGCIKIAFSADRQDNKLLI